jgi:hypothetical protein
MGGFSATGEILDESSTTWQSDKSPTKVPRINSSDPKDQQGKISSRHFVFMDHN